MTTQELRQSFLDFFAQRGHKVYPSASLIPGDPTLLFTSAGMVPFKDKYLGLGLEDGRRAASCQKCFRTGDLERVGYTRRHNTFFEMLGNFSFGDYFKAETLAWGWEYLTKVAGLDAKRLHPTIHSSDDEAEAIWRKILGEPNRKIIRLADNWWGPVGPEGGPCGPDSEIYWDHGAGKGCGKPDCAPGCDCGRYEEVWNHVFQQYNRDKEGKDHPLEKPGIDTGMGLDRLASIVQGVDSNYDSEAWARLKASVKETLGPAPDPAPYHVVCDHLRAAVFLMSEGIRPSNEGRGYVLRRVIRRASRFAHQLGHGAGVLSGLAPKVVEIWGPVYPEIQAALDRVSKGLREEEDRFHQTLKEGLGHLNALKSKASGGRVSGQEVFRLYDTYGFPEDLSAELLREAGIKYDREEFLTAMEAQKELARASWKGSGVQKASDALKTLAAGSGGGKFCGYSALEAESKLSGLFARDKILAGNEEIREGESAALVLTETPFYAESGGQVGDRGRLLGPRGIFEVEDCQHLPGGGTVHLGRVVSGVLSSGEKVKAEVDALRRHRAAIHHTATHLLHAKLFEKLGSHVSQAGSLVGPERLRFDFHHGKAMSPEELREVERKVNQHIREDLPVETKEMGMKEALARGAKAFFQDKYGDRVRVVTIGGVSVELCGGTHLKSSGEIGAFSIASEGSVAAGVRRVEALGGEAAEEQSRKAQELIGELARILKSSKEEVLGRVQDLLKSQKELRTKLEKGVLAGPGAGLDGLLEKSKKIGAREVLLGEIAGADANGLKAALDQIRSKKKLGAVFLAGSQEGKASLLAWMDNPDPKGLNAQKLIQATSVLVGGKGGGRPDMAQAGGPNAAGLKEALAKAEELLAS